VAKVSGRRIATWIISATLVVAALTAGTVYYLRARKSLTLSGAITVQDSNPDRQLPIADVQISEAHGLALASAASDSSGFFKIKLQKGVRHGRPIVLQFRNPNYRPLDLNDVVSDKLYVVRLAPKSPEVTTAGRQPVVAVANVRARYSTEAIRTMNIGSAVKTFQVKNVGNLPCLNKAPCSPDGRWKAGIGSASLDAGPGNEFRDARVSCIAGPCPFTKIDTDNFSRGGQIISVTARGWSDTTTFLFEAEVFQEMPTAAVYESYPVIFGRTLNFTVPTGAEGVSIEADMAGGTVIFPLGPDLFLSWANCNVRTNPDHTTVYRCQLKSGFSFQ
jgi:hypothetical protein